MAVYDGANIDTDLARHVEEREIGGGWEVVDMEKRLQKKKRGKKRKKRMKGKSDASEMKIQKKGAEGNCWITK